MGGLGSEPPIGSRSRGVETAGVVGGAVTSALLGTSKSGNLLTVAHSGVGWTASFS